MSGSTVVVHVRGLRSDQGVVRVALFSSEEGFPTRAERAEHHGAAPIRDGRAEVVFHGVAPGTWAASVLHDENARVETDGNALGLWREGRGPSGGREWRLGLPVFEKSAFEVQGEGETRVGVRARYLLTGLLGA